MIIKTVNTALAVVLFAGVFAFPTGASDERAVSSEHKFELARQYYGQCAGADVSRFDAIRPQLNAFTDMEVMAETMADPGRFMQLMAVVNDPHTIHVMTRCATEPVMWDTWMLGITDFDKMSRAMVHFANPNLYFAWMMAPMQPAMYKPMMQMAQPDYYNRWMTALGNPVFYQPITSLADPSWYAPRIAWMMNPQSMQPLFELMNPAQSGASALPEAAN